MKRKTKIILAVIPSVIFIGLIIGSLVFLSQSYDPMDEAISALESSSDVTILNDKKWITFTPTNFTSKAGFVFYPGGNVEPESYALIARGIAEEGFFVSIIKMPFDLAVFAPNKAAKLISLFPEITNWFIGGHSLGGSMAASFVSNSAVNFTGLVFLASYPSNSINLSTSTIKVLSIYGSLDGVLSKPINEISSQLPESTIYLKIDGGNHAYFGSYGEQKDDLEATITRAEQQQITIGAISAFISNNILWLKLSHLIL